MIKKDDQREFYRKSELMKELDEKIQNLFQKYGCLEDFKEFKKSADNHNISDDIINDFFSALIRFSDEDRELLIYMWAEMSNLI